MVQMGQTSLPNGDQFPRSGERFHVPRTLRTVERRDSKIATLANLARGQFVDDLDGNFGQQLGRGQQRLSESAVDSQGLKCLDRMRLRLFEVAGAQTPQSG